jgi:hypothetical protein
MKSLSLKVMTLLMAALVLSASGCFNDEMSSPEGTVKGFYRALNQWNYYKMLTYIDPRVLAEEHKRDTIEQYYRIANVGTTEPHTDVKITLVSKKDGLVWKGDKWGSRKEATVEATYKDARDGKKREQKHTLTLVLLHNKWYIEEVPWIRR